MSNETDTQLHRLTRQVQRSLNQMFEIPGALEPGSGLDQLGLQTGTQIVENFVEHGETGLALEHLIYMIEEPQVLIDEEAHSLLISLFEIFSLTAEIERFLKRPRASQRQAN